jgi:hypothetical protein
MAPPGGAVVTPQGRLTLTSNTPVMVADATAQGSIYYAPYVGNQAPIYDGSDWWNRTFSQLTMALDTTNQTGGNVYDLYLWNNSGTVALGCGPAWLYSSTITVTIASPAVVSWTGHGLNEARAVVFTTSGALPTGITAGTIYYVGRSPGANSFNIATTPANAAAGTFINTSGSQSGTHTATVGTVSRGTGAGTTELQLLSGIWTNKNTITLTNGAGAGSSVPANRATYVGSAYMTANGQTGMSFLPAAASGGTANFLALYNAYNRVTVSAQNRDAKASWTYSVTTWRAGDGGSGNDGWRIVYLDGLQQSPVVATLNVTTQGSVAGSDGFIGLNLDNTTNAPQNTTQSTGAVVAQLGVTDCWAPQLGAHYITAMEAGGATGTRSYFGAQSTPTRQLNSLIVSVAL